MIDTLKSIIKDCPANVVLIGMDIGTKTIGIALSDSSQSIAMPLCTIKRTKFSRDIKELEKIIREYDVGGYVLGYPVNMDGSEGGRCQSVRDFGLEFIAQLSPDLKNSAEPWVALWDERLSTASVESFVDDTVNISRRRAKEKGILDKLAAQHILQGALDYLSANA